VKEHGVRGSRVWKVLLGVEHTVIESVDLEQDPAGGERVVARVRPTKRQRLRCPHCRRACRRADAGDGRRRWRALDLGTVQAFLEADAPRIACPLHGIVVAYVPWARHDSRFTAGFEDTATWLAAHASASAVAELLRSSWRAVTGIITRVVAEARGRVDRLAGLRRIGIDEVAYRKGHRYLMVVTDHVTGRVVWAHPGRNQDTVRAFFDALGQQRAAQLTHVSCDGAEWIHDVITERAPQAVICLDPFHAVQWATDAIDELRRRITRDLKAAGRTEDATALKGSRWALLKNPDKLTGPQHATLASIKTTNDPLYRAYLMKEQLREVFAQKGNRGRRLLLGVISWMSHSKIPEMVALAKTLHHFQNLIYNTLDHELSNARAEATNTHIRLLTRQAYGFHTPEALIAMVELTRGGLCPPLPGRAS
jgi:transposase